MNYVQSSASIHLKKIIKEFFSCNRKPGWKKKYKEGVLLSRRKTDTGYQYDYTKVVFDSPADWKKTAKEPVTELMGILLKHDSGEWGYLSTSMEGIRASTV